MAIRNAEAIITINVDKQSMASAENAMKTLKSTAAKLLGAIGIGFSVNALKNFGKECVSAASDISEMESKFNVVFKQDKEKWNAEAEDLANKVGRSTYKIKTYMADQQNLLAGFTDGTAEAREATAQMSKEMTKWALDIASFGNIDEDVTVQRMTKAVMGSTDAAAGLGAVLNDLTRAEAMARLGMKGNYKDLDQISKMQVNLEAITYQSKDAYNDCAYSMGRYESNTRSLASVQEDFKVTVGKGLMPVMTLFTNVQKSLYEIATKVAKAIFGETTETNRLQKVVDRINALVKRVQPAVERMKQSLDRIREAVGRFIDRIGGAENVFRIVTMALAGFFLVMNWGKITSAAAGFLNVLKKLFSFATLKIAAVVGLVLLVGLVIEDFIYFLTGNDSVLGEVFDKLGINADEVRQTIFNAFEKIRETVGNIIESVKTTIGKHIGPMVNSVKRIWNGIWSLLQAVWGAIRPFAEMIFGGLFSFLGSLDFGTIFETIVSAIDGLLNILANVGDWISEHQGAIEVVITLLTSLGGAIAIVFTAMKAFKTAKTIFSAVKGGFSLVSGGAKLFMGAISALSPPVLIAIGVIAALIAIGVLLYKNWDKVKEAVSKFVNNVKEGFANLKAAVSEKISGIIESLRNGFQSFQGVWDAIGGIINGFRTILQGIGDFISAVFSGNWSGAWEAIKTIFTGVWEVIKNYISGVWSWIQLLLEMGLTAIQNVWNTVWGAISGFFTDIWNGITSFLSSVVEGIASTVGGIWENISSGFDEAIEFITSLPEKALQWGKDFINGLIDGITDAVDGVVDAVKGVGEKIAGFLHFSTPDEGPLKDYESWMPDFMKGLAASLDSSGGAVLNKIKTMATSIRAMMTDAVSDSMGQLQLLADGTSSVMSAVAAAKSTVALGAVNTKSSSVTQNVSIANSYSGSTPEVQRSIAKTMNKSAVDATTEMARGLAYARG